MPGDLVPGTATPPEPSREPASIGPRAVRSIATLGSRAAAEEATLVLTATGIAWQLEAGDAGWNLRVAAGDAARASETLAAYLRERSQPAPSPAVMDHPGGAVAGIAVAVCLYVFFLLLAGQWLPSPEWTAHGSAATVRIREGEWWRVVTALTLHADFLHVLGNTFSMALFATGVCRWFGPGVGLSLILAAGAAGNGVNAMVRGDAHTTVGASTAIFGAVGILTAVQLLRRRETRRRGLMRMRGWVPLGGGLALLALLGTSPRSDLGAHLFGFASGAALGWIAARAHAERITGSRQTALVLAAVAAVGLCWTLALSS